MTKNNSFYSREESKRIVFSGFSMFLQAEKMVYIYPCSKDKREYVRSFFFFILVTTFFWITTLQSHCSVQIINNCNRCSTLVLTCSPHHISHLSFVFAHGLGWKLQKITHVEPRPYPVNYVTFDSKLCLICTVNSMICSDIWHKYH